MKDPLKPSAALLAKLASVVVHAAEYGSPFGGHDFDLIAMQSALYDSEVVEWYRAMRKLEMAPLPRYRIPKMDAT